MPRRSREYGTPKSWVTAGGQWPDGPFRSDAPAIVGYARDIALALGEATAGRNKAELCTAAGIERSTLYDLLGGNTWADLITLAKLEGVLGRTLWPATQPDLPTIDE
jgi:hypothetical protein